jgi:hypothetical protein
LTPSEWESTLLWWVFFGAIAACVVVYFALRNY